MCEPIVNTPICRHCKRETHPAYVARYDGLCLDCENAGVGELLKRIAELEAECERLRALQAGACERIAAEAMIALSHAYETDVLTEGQEVYVLRKSVYDYYDTRGAVERGKVVSVERNGKAATIVFADGFTQGFKVKTHTGFAVIPSSIPNKPASDAPSHPPSP